MGRNLDHRKPSSHAYVGTDDWLLCPPQQWKKIFQRWSLSQLKNEYLCFKPGSASKYSNIGFRLLGHDDRAGNRWAICKAYLKEKFLSHSVWTSQPLIILIRWLFTCRKAIMGTRKCRGLTTRQACQRPVQHAEGFDHILKFLSSSSTCQLKESIITK